MRLISNTDEVKGRIFFLIESVIVSALRGGGALRGGHTSLGDFFTAQQPCLSLQEVPNQTLFLTQAGSI